MDEIFRKSPNIIPVAVASSRTKRALTTIGKDCSTDDETFEEVDTDCGKTNNKKAKKQIEEN